MKKRILLLLVALLFAGAASDAREVKGRVCCDGKGVGGVEVSDGVSIVRTDSRGRYVLDLSPESRFVFLSTPSGYISSTRGGETCFWKAVREGERRYDFSLEKNPQDDTCHEVVVLADPQISDAEEFPLLRENARSLSAEAAKLRSEHYTFGICLGDIVGWNHALYGEYNEIMDSTLLEFRSVIGNHDMTNYGRSFETSTADYERTYGPTYYSYNVGRVHHIVLNDNFFVGKDWYYIGYLPEKQLRWMEEDLRGVSPEKLVVLSIHIPTTLDPKDRTGYYFDYGMISEVLCNKKAIYDILAPYRALILSGHIHTCNNQMINDRLEEHNITSLGGAWWCGPVCIDGSPAGFKVYSFNGTDVNWRFVSCENADVSVSAEGTPSSYVQTPNETRGEGDRAEGHLKVYVDDPMYPGEVVANVWDYDGKWKVECFADGVKICDMERFRGTDPLAAALYKDPSSLKRSWVCATPTPNLFRAPLPEGAKSITVRVTDRFGRTWKISADNVGSVDR